MSFIARGHLGVTLVAMTTHVDNTNDIEVTTALTPEKDTTLSDAKELKDLEEFERNKFNETDDEIVSNGTIGFNSTEKPRSIYSVSIVFKIVSF